MKKLKKCCEKHIRNIYKKVPTIVWGRFDCPKCKQFWGFTGFSNDIDKEIEELKKNL